MDNTIFTVLKLLGSLALLMYGMKVMSEGFQKLTGDRLRNILGAMTTNRFTGLLTGAFVTAAVQSSTATTVMTVSFVNAGLLALTQAISVIIGTNIGTTVTAWVMSIFGFQFNMTNVIYPLFALSLPLIFSKKSCNNLARTIKHRNEGKPAFTDKQNHNIDKIFELATKSVYQMNSILKKPELNVVQAVIEKKYKYVTFILIGYLST